MVSTDKGYIKLYRDIRDHWIWSGDDEPFDRAHAWIDLIMLMNHKDRETLFDGRMIVVKRGHKITSLRKLSKRWNWSIHKVSDFLNTLEEAGMISQVRDTKKTLINVINYDFYQGSDSPSGTQKGHRRNTQGTQKRHSRDTEGNKQDIKKNVEECKKKEEEETPALTDEELRERGWLD